MSNPQRDKRAVNLSAPLAPLAPPVSFTCAGVRYHRVGTLKDVTESSLLLENEYFIRLAVSSSENVFARMTAFLVDLEMGTVKIFMNMHGEDVEFISDLEESLYTTF